jgi:rhodanese-related sulfurtransferase
MKKHFVSFLLAGIVSASPAVFADTVKGRIDHISEKARSIQIKVKDSEPVVVRFGDNTTYEGVGGIKDLGKADLISVEFEPGAPASRIKKITFGLPAGVEISLQELIAILQGKSGPYVLGDARPQSRYDRGHIPSARPTPVADTDPEAFKALLPEDKGQLVVFYCGGPTCPFTGEAAEQAQAAGYTNIKGFQAGMPAWRKAKLPLHANREWLAKHLDEHHVVIDVRDPAAAGEAHVPGAVSLPSGRISEMTQEFIAAEKVAQLPGVRDTRAPIIVYSDTHASQDVVRAFRELVEWGYEYVSILEGGFSAWTADGLPTASGELASEFKYTKALVKGAVTPEDFGKLEQSRENVVFLDVRTDAEVAKSGVLKDAVHIPLDSLENRLGELPKDKEIVTYCENGIRAEMAYRTLQQNGYQGRFLNDVIEIDSDGGYRL